MKAFPLRIPTILYEQVKDASWDARTSMNQLIGRILADYFKKTKGDV